MLKPVRRLIVAQNLKDQSVIVEEQSAMPLDHYMAGVENAISINLWMTHQSPASIKPQPDPILAKASFLPPLNGTIFRICDIPPDSEFIHRLDEILLNGEKITTEQKMLPHPLMHKHEPATLTYALVLSGEVTLVLDQAQTVLKTGDVVIDCSSHHAWSNHTSEICRMAFVLMGATTLD